MKEIKFSTEVGIKPSEWRLGQHSNILTIGSCFADVLGSQLSQYKFNVLNNPLGTVFNPLAICKILDSAVDDRKPNPDLYVQNADQVWLHHDFHSSQWSSHREALESQMVDRLQAVKAFLKETNVLVITLGTSYAYRHKQTNQIIGNCHKATADQFVKELLHPDQINMAMEQLVQKLLMFQRQMRIILTVSPVRHTRDTLPLNQVSKATLRLVCHRLSEKYKHIEYFPSYEIMVDELRDYRFYGEDLIHPNKMAEDFIFNQFARTYLDQGSMDFMEEWTRIIHAMEHRHQHGYTPGQHKLLLSLRAKLNSVAEKVDVSKELAEIERRLAEFPVGDQTH
jgi:lysophospholipase L1-like esterase